MTAPTATTRPELDTRQPRSIQQADRRRLLDVGWFVGLSLALAVAAVAAGVAPAARPVHPRRRPGGHRDRPGLARGSGRPSTAPPLADDPPGGPPLVSRPRDPRPVVARDRGRHGRARRADRRPVRHAVPRRADRPARRPAPGVHRGAGLARLRAAEAAVDDVAARRRRSSLPSPGRSCTPSCSCRASGTGTWRCGRWSSASSRTRSC